MHLLGSYVWPLLDEILRWLKAEVKDEARKAVSSYLNENYGGWKEIVKTAVEKSIDAAIEALKAVKEEVTKVCLENAELMKQLGKVVVKVTAREVITKTGVKVGAREAARATAKCVVSAGTKRASKFATRRAAQVATKETVKLVTRGGTKFAAKEATKLGSKSLLKASNPIGIGADLAQAGLEAAGYEDAGKAVGVTGNMASGALMGAAIGGPVGAAVGATGGFLVWGLGEVVGGLVNKAF